MQTAMLLAAALLVAQGMPPDAGLRMDGRAVAVSVRLQDPASVAPRLQLTPSGLTTTSFFRLRRAGFPIADSADARVTATVRIAPTVHRYRTRDGAGVGTTGIAYIVRVHMGRRVYVVDRGRIDAMDAVVWEVERFGTASADSSGGDRIQDDLSECLTLFASAFEAANPGP